MYKGRQVYHGPGISCVFLGMGVGETGGAVSMTKLRLVSSECSIDDKEV